LLNENSRDTSTCYFVKADHNSSFEGLASFETRDHCDDTSILDSEHGTLPHQWIREQGDEKDLLEPVEPFGQGEKAESTPVFR